MSGLSACARSPTPTADARRRDSGLAPGCVRRAFRLTGVRPGCRPKIVTHDHFWDADQLRTEMNAMAKTSDAAFISYRRDTGQILATALFQGLAASGADVFLDSEGIRSGVFDEAILTQIEVRPYFLLVLTPGT